MKKLTIKLTNCYGIRSLDTELNFDPKRANIIYAPNGTMKSSLAKTFRDLSENKKPSDRIYKSRETKCLIADENNIAIQPEQIFVIDSYSKSYESSRVSSLLVNKELKEEYDNILKLKNLHLKWRYERFA